MASLTAGDRLSFVSRRMSLNCLAAAMMAGVLPAQASPAAYIPIELTPLQLSTDIALLKQAIAHVHAGYNRYMPARVLDTAFARLERRAAAPMADTAFYRDVALLLATMRCGHTKAEYSDRLDAYREQTATHLPVIVRIFGRRMFVARSSVATIARGSEILNINGTPVGEVITRLSRYAAIDGFTDFARTSLLERDSDLMGSDLDHYWPIEFGFANWCNLDVLSSAHVRSRVTVRAITFAAWKTLAGEASPIDFRTGTRFAMMNDMTATLTIRSFVNYRTPVDADSLYRSIFGQLQSRRVTHLIVDLRDNSGGSDDAANGLIRFLADTSILPLRAVRRRSITFDSTLAAAFETWGDRAPIFSPPPDLFARDSSGWFTERSRDAWIAPDAASFRGHVSVLVGHRNASGATMLLATLQQIGARTGRLRLVGEETGGSAEGPTAGRILFLRLPNSGICVRIPLLRSDVNVTSVVPGFGVFPDVDATETLSDFRAGIDRALVTARTAKWTLSASALAPTTGLMRGALEYRDYGSGKRVVLPTWQHTAPIGGSGAFRQRLIYDDGPGNIIYTSDAVELIGNRWMEGAGGNDGQAGAKRTTLRIVSRARTATGLRFELRGTGIDDDKPVEFRYTVTLGDSMTTRLKEFRSAGGAWQFRHSYAFSRIAK